jgi:hypothetical protein
MLGALASASVQPPTDSKMDNKKKDTIEDESSKEILSNLADPEKKFKLSPELDPK